MRGNSGIGFFTTPVSFVQGKMLIYTFHITVYSILDANALIDILLTQLFQHAEKYLNILYNNEGFSVLHDLIK